MARRNARVKLDCEENWQSSAISPSDARPGAIIALALSSRRWLTYPHLPREDILCGVDSTSSCPV